MKKTFLEVHNVYSLFLSSLQAHFRSHCNPLSHCIPAVSCLPTKGCRVYGSGRAPLHNLGWHFWGSCEKELWESLQKDTHKKRQNYRDVGPLRVISSSKIQRERHQHETPQNPKRRLLRNWGVTGLSSTVKQYLSNIKDLFWGAMGADPYCHLVSVCLATCLVRLVNM